MDAAFVISRDFEKMTTRPNRTSTARTTRRKQRRELVLRLGHWSLAFPIALSKWLTGFVQSTCVNRSSVMRCSTLHLRVPCQTAQQLHDPSVPISVEPPAALLNSSSESSIEPLGGAGIVMCTQLSAFSTTFTSIPSGTSMSYSARTALGSAHEASLQGLVLPARGKQGRELVLLLGHWSFLF